MTGLAVVWCLTCDQPATGLDERCDFCRAGGPGAAITDPWLRSQWLQARRIPAAPPLCPDCGHPEHAREDDDPCFPDCEVCRDEQDERNQIEAGRFT